METILQGHLGAHEHVSLDPLATAVRVQGSPHMPRNLVPDADADGVRRRQRAPLQTFEGVDTYQGGVQAFSRVAPAGIAVARFTVPPGQQWRVERLAVKTQSVPATTVLVYVVGSGYTCQAAAEPFPDMFLADASLSGNLDIADQNSPILVPSQHELVVCWTGLTAASVAKCSVSAQYLIEAT